MGWARLFHFLPDALKRQPMQQDQHSLRIRIGSAADEVLVDPLTWDLENSGELRLLAAFLEMGNNGSHDLAPKRHLFSRSKGSTVGVPLPFRDLLSR